MEPLNPKEKLLLLWGTWRNICINLKMYLSHSREAAERTLRVNKNFEEFNTKYAFHTDSGEYGIEEGDVYIPLHSTMTVEGDGYRMLVENYSNFNKTFYWSIKRDNTREFSNNPPPLFDEGEEYE